MSGPLAGRGAVVTGGGRGIGAAVAAALAQAGAAVVVCARTPEEIDQVAQHVNQGGGRAVAVPCDVTSAPAVEAMGKAARAFLKTVDILVNNAGAAASAPLKRITLPEWDRMLAVNATGTFLCTQQFVPDMVSRKWGRVVNVASSAGLSGAKYIAHYSAAKHAVVGFTRSVAAEVEGSGVTVNALCPAYVDTAMTEATLANVQQRTGMARDEALSAVLGSVGQARLITPQEVAAAIVRLCGEAAHDVNGEAIVLDGRSNA